MKLKFKIVLATLTTIAIAFCAQFLACDFYGSSGYPVLSFCRNLTTYHTHRAVVYIEFQAEDDIIDKVANNFREYARLSKMSYVEIIGNDALTLTPRDSKKVKWRKPYFRATLATENDTRIEIGFSEDTDNYSLAIYCVNGNGDWKKDHKSMEEFVRKKWHIDSVKTSEKACQFGEKIKIE